MTVIDEPVRGAFIARFARATVVIALAALAAVALPAVADAAQKRQPPSINVMSRNLYLGSDLVPALTAQSAAELYEEAGTVWRNMQETNFNARAKLLAEEIRRNNVEVVGLQEVALWRRDTKGAPDGPATPAEEVVYDFLHQLRSELSARGLQFRVASRQPNADLEVPLDFGSGIPSYDGRLTMYDVILVKRTPRLRIQGSRSGNYGPAVPVPLPGLGVLSVLRGWNAVELMKRSPGKPRRAIRSRFRVVNTHLEAFSAFFRTAQASELVTSGVLNAPRKPVIVVGDLNSDPDDPTSSNSPPDPAPTLNAAAYGLIANAGFVDRGVAVNTCCHDDDLLNPPPAAFSSRIDHVLTKPGLRRQRSALVGIDPLLRTPTGLWPSDHGGVFSRLRLRR